ncbi:hypothetical protein CR513_42475, partial [Mucuna pruriens]
MVELKMGSRDIQLILLLGRILIVDILIFLVLPESFQMHVAIMCTINDFSAYANLSRWSTRGQYACLCCGLEIAFKWLRYNRKFCCMCHKWRYKKANFMEPKNLELHLSYLMELLL